MGGRVSCVSCWDTDSCCPVAYRKKDGCDVAELRRIADRFGEIDRAEAEAKGYETVPGDVWIEQDVDILIPAAMENQIGEHDATRISPRVRLVAEGANGPTTPDADSILADRGIVVIPDILANAGGVTCSYFEQVQSNMNYFWRRDEVIQRLDSKITSACKVVSDTAERSRVCLRDAAYLIAVDRVAKACKQRGWV
jgi:glutamate dehydrogenase (NAD(P)+)